MAVKVKLQRTVKRKEHKMNKGIEISFNSDAFYEIRASLDKTLNTVFKKMKTRDSDQATIDLRIGIKLENVKTVDSRSGETMTVKNPEIKYKVTHKLEYKNSESEEGTIQRTDSYLACEGGQWVIRPVEDGQMTIQSYVQQGGRS